MTTNPTTSAEWSKDWRITLGITLGVIVFSGACIWFGKTTEQAWLTLQIVTGVCIGGSALKEWLSK